MTITLYQFPGACSRVTMNALEEIGLDFVDVPVNIRQKPGDRGDYLAINPTGKVPVLVFGDTVMKENAAILWTLHGLHPESGLLPQATDPLAAHAYLADLVWCSGTMHPMVRQARMPQKWTTGPSEGVREDGIAKLLVEGERIERRIGDGWWYPSGWSIVDTYIYWGFSTAAKGGFPIDRFAGLLGHAERVRARPSFQRVLAREQQAVSQLGLTDLIL